MTAPLQVIITRNSTLVFNAERANEPLVKSFVAELQRRLASPDASDTHDIDSAAANAPLDTEAAERANGAANGATAAGSIPEHGYAYAPLTSAAERGNGSAVDLTATAADAVAAAAAAASQEAQQLESAAAMAGSAQEQQAREIPYELQARRCLSTCTSAVP